MASRMLLIVGSCEPLYEAEFTQSNAPKQSEETAHLNQFILHSAMDMVDMAMEEKADMCASRPRPFSPRRAKRRRYLRIVDKFNDQNVFAYVTAGQVKFLLLHEGRNEDAVRNFFLEVHELYVKLVMNPFYEHDTPITSPTFDRAVHALARRHL